MQNGTLPKDCLRIPLRGKNGKGLFVLVSQEDYDEMSKSPWYLSSDGYAYNPKIGYMQKILMHPPKGMCTDHKNRNRLDNRRGNLRVVTPSENSKNNSFKGYGYRDSLKRWVVNFVKEDGKWSSRSYKTEEEAKEATRLIDSGVLPPKKIRERGRYMPKHISQTAGSDTFVFRCVINGKVYRKCGLKNIVEAIAYRDNFFDKIKLNQLDKGGAYAK